MSVASPVAGSTANCEYFSQCLQSKALSQVLEITRPASSWRQRRSDSGNSAKSDFQHNSIARLVRKSRVVRHTAETTVVKIVTTMAKNNDKKTTSPPSTRRSSLEFLPQRRVRAWLPA